ncbi:hypothetical protein PFTANZ_06000 [Plasmodium falciparum Tanzania (2000708)]|uniref:Surface antigen n=1 Tax=Plasmodium falciparum Tanzania (2000708) TaxID=1036725 RepID=A0A024VYD9_PLAFA|nr:hypothetical protein PFTANZ_06000 [Plasmodium falciparum Tanzania (2000708)]
MEQQLTTLETKIDTNDIPTCICEKSVADKTEKVCLNCGKTMGAVTPAWSLLNGIGYAAWTHYVVGLAAKAATDAGVKAATEGLIDKFLLHSFSPSQMKTIVTIQNYSNQNLLIHSVQHTYNTMCWKGSPNSEEFLCLIEDSTEAAKFIAHQTRDVAVKAGQAAKTAEAAEAAKYTSTTSIYSTYIIASVIAIVVIVLVMVIIYLILRYLRKKKMKKKLQYIKLLKE